MKQKPKMTIDKNGNKFWYLNGHYHREDGPAVEGADGAKHWYLNGERHREDGPAFELASGEKIWYLHDERMTEAQFLDWKFIQWCTTPVKYVGVVDD